MNSGVLAGTNEIISPTTNIHYEAGRGITLGNINDTNALVFGMMRANITSNIPLESYDGTNWLPATEDATKLPLAGGTMSGTLDMNSQTISNALLVRGGSTVTIKSEVGPSASTLDVESGSLDFKLNSVTRLEVGANIVMLAPSGYDATSGLVEVSGDLAPRFPSKEFDIGTASNTWNNLRVARVYLLDTDTNSWIEPYSSGGTVTAYNFRVNGTDNIVP